MKNISDKPKKCGITGFINKNLTNEDNTSYYLGPIILELWRNCDGNRTVDDLVKLISKESEENTEIPYTATLINEMLNLLEARKLITYTTFLGS